jgi:hypothetical protein
VVNLEAADGQQSPFGGIGTGAEGPWRIRELGMADCGIQLRVSHRPPKSVTSPNYIDVIHRGI